MKQQQIDKTQRLVERYCKLVMRELYGETIEIFFQENLYSGGERAVGIFRGKDSLPAVNDIEIIRKYIKNPCNSITFSSPFISDKCDWLSELDRLWHHMIHEITHYEVGVICSEKGRVSHPIKFYSTMNKNKRKVHSLKLNFMEYFKQ